MIDGIDIHNFQSHDDTSIKFHPGVNVLVGKSDNGKSVIMRAIKWFKDNNIRDKGDKGSKATGGVPYASDWIKTDKGAIKKGKEVSVVLHKDGASVTRFRSSEANGYMLGTTVLKAIGKDVPDEVEAFLNMDAVNLQRQFDSPFLISYAPGDVSRFFNRIVRLESIDRATSAIDSKKRATNADLKVANAEIKKLNIDIEKYTWVSSAEKALAKVEGLECKKIEAHREYNVLAELMEEIYEKTEEINDCLDIAKATKLLSKISDSLETYADNSDTLETISEIVSEAHELDTTISRNKVLERCLPKIQSLFQKVDECTAAKEEGESFALIIRAIRKYNMDLEDVIPLTTSEIKVDIKFLEKLNIKYEKEKTVAETLENTYNKIEELNTDIKDCDEIIKETEKQLPDECPLCGGTFDIDKCM